MKGSNKLITVGLFVIFISVVTIGAYLIFGRSSRVLPGEVKDVNGDVHVVNTNYKLKDMVAVCDKAKDFSMVSMYVTISSVGEEDSDFYWKLPDACELSSVDSTKGAVEYVESEDGVIVGIAGGSDIQLIFYLKTENLDDCLNGVIVSNGSAPIGYGFTYRVILPDMATIDFDICEEEGKDLNWYFKNSEYKRVG